MDAILGALALGDIGKLFPDTDPAYAGIASIKLLREVGRLLGEKGFTVVNVDATLLAQAIVNMKQTGTTVVLVTHKPSVLSIVDNIMLLQDGAIAMCGPRQAVLDKMAEMRRQQQQQAEQARLQREELARRQQEALQKAGTK